MTPNPIDEIKQIRHQLGAEAGFDIHRIFAELRESQASSGRTYVSHHARRVADNQVLHGSFGGESTLHNESSPETP